MGKKSTFKKLRRQATELPALTTTAYLKEPCSGAEVLKDGITMVNEKPVDPKGTYTKRTPVAVAVNHGRRMKKMFIKHGTAGVDAYVRSVHNVVKKQQAPATA